MLMMTVAAAASLVTSILFHLKASNGQECGRYFPPKTSRSDQMIMGGIKVTSDGLFPWIVGLMNTSSTHCAGTIINSEWVVTAAHCTEPPFGVVKLKAGSSQRSRYASMHTVVKVIVHSHKREESDIALLQVSPPFSFTEGDSNNNGAIQPICLPKTGEEFYGKVTIVGWGTERDTGNKETLEFPNTLNYVQVDLMNNKLCRMQAAYYTENAYFCTSAGSESFVKGPCYGDSGGPVIGISNQKAYLLGIVSGGRRHPYLCGQEDNPALHVKVANFRLWIFSHTNV